MGEFRMPALGAGMEEGRVIEWYVRPGDRVRRGQLIALVETDKANIDVEVFEDGTVGELLVEVGTKVPVGAPLARIVGEEAAAAPSPTPEPVPGTAEPPEPAVAAEPPEPAVAAEPPEPVTATRRPEPAVAAEPPEPAVAHPVRSPLVRRIAAEHGLDLDAVEGSGKGGRVTRGDVAKAVAAAPGRPAADARVRSSPYARRLATDQGRGLGGLRGTGPGGAVVARDLTGRRPGTDASSGAGTGAGTGTAAPPVGTPPADAGSAMRLGIARAMERSNREIPHFHLAEHVDVEDALRGLEAHNANLPAATRVLPAALVLRAVAAACRALPALNGTWEDDRFQPGDGIHLGVAISLRGGGLLTPAIRHADRLSLDELMAALRDLVQRTRRGGLRGSELTDGTITVTNLGETGAETVHGVIQPPQVALVGVGRITERPWACDGMLTVRRVLHLSLAVDHRACDGHLGSRFLAAIATNLTEPEGP